MTYGRTFLRLGVRKAPVFSVLALHAVWRRGSISVIGFSHGSHLSRLRCGGSQKTRQRQDAGVLLAALPESRQAICFSCLQGLRHRSRPEDSEGLLEEVLHYGVSEKVLSGESFAA
jgi:hypothetical protein